MKQLGKLADIASRVDACRKACLEQDMPFHADALAAALGISYDTMLQYAKGGGEVARLLSAALQDCTASVIGYALTADPKSHPLWMFYLRNRAGFADKGENRPSTADLLPVQFVGEERIE